MTPHRTLTVLSLLTLWGKSPIPDEAYEEAKRYDSLISDLEESLKGLVSCSPDDFPHLANAARSLLSRMEAGK